MGQAALGDAEPASSGVGKQDPAGGLRFVGYAGAGIPPEISALDPARNELAQAYHLDRRTHRSGIGDFPLPAEIPEKTLGLVLRAARRPGFRNLQERMEAHR